MSDQTPATQPANGSPVLAARVGPKGTGTNANLIDGAARGRGEAIRQQGGVGLAGGGAAAQAAAARAAGYPANVMPDHLRREAAAQAAAPGQPKELIVIGQYGEGLLVHAVELDGSVVLIASTSDGKHQSNTCVPLPAGSKIEVEAAEGRLMAEGENLVLVAFGFLKSFGGRLLVSVSQNGNLSSTWQGGLD
jgi:hypothetical protein